MRVFIAPPSDAVSPQPLDPEDLTAADKTRAVRLPCCAARRCGAPAGRL